MLGSFLVLNLNEYVYGTYGIYPQILIFVLCQENTIEKIRKSLIG